LRSPRRANDRDAMSLPRTGDRRERPREPLPPCPKCQKPPAVTSRTEYVLYLRCAGCGHVWAIPKTASRL